MKNNSNSAVKQLMVSLFTSSLFSIDSFQFSNVDVAKFINYETKAIVLSSSSSIQHSIIQCSQIDKAVFLNLKSFKP